MDYKESAFSIMQLQTSILLLGRAFSFLKFLKILHPVSNKIQNVIAVLLSLLF
jgi:hypothetical protein